MNRKNSIAHRFVAWFLKKIMRRYEYRFTQELDMDRAIIVANHAQLFGPLAQKLFSPYPNRIWMIGEMMKMKTVPAYARKDFWPNCKWYSRWFFFLLSYLIAPIAVILLKSDAVIPVYTDLGIKTTIKETIETIEEKKAVVIFPEHRQDYNHIINGFQKNFVSVAKVLYANKKVKTLFYPTYVCKNLHVVLVGIPIEYNPELPIKEECERIVSYLQEEITKLALSLPSHKIVPYVNNKKRIMSK